MKDERELLTKETVKRKLIREARRSLIGSLLALILGLLVLGASYLMTSLSHEPAPPAAVIAEGVLFALLVCACVLFFVRGVRRIRSIRRDELSIVEDYLLDVIDDRLSPSDLLISGNPLSRASYKHVFRFGSGRVFSINSRAAETTHLGTAAQFSMPGDLFYVVFYHNAPEKLVYVYSAKLYRFEG